MNGAPLALEDFLHPWVSRYLGAPSWLQATAGRAYACLPPALRYGRAYGEFRATLEATRDAAAARAFALARLEETLAWALETVPAYQDYRGLAAGGRDARAVLRELPVTDKLDIKRNPASYLSRGDARLGAAQDVHGWLDAQRRCSSGCRSTSRGRASTRSCASCAIGWRAGGQTWCWRFAGARLPPAAHPGGRPWMHEPVKRQLVISSEHLARRYLPSCAAALARFRPALHRGLPSALYPLARWLEAHPLPGVHAQRARHHALFRERVRLPDGDAEASLRLPHPRPLRPLRARADGGDSPRRRALLLLAAVRLAGAARRAGPPGHAARQARLRGGHELRQQRDAVRALPHGRPRHALGGWHPRGRGLPGGASASPGGCRNSWCAATSA